MADIINLLPENIANQIAAGEVVQRPSSVVKELLENAVDAGATQISLLVKEGGKALIQVIDNGKGMSETDARMCFERHATSKIKTADDLFAISTKGFRGEALAAISSVAQVELKTKTAEVLTGTSVIIEGGNFISQEPCQCANGTSFSVKNLFFNVPARRNFLKDDTIELRHIIDEFERVAMAHTDVGFKLISNTNEVYNLPPTNLLLRVAGLAGNTLKDKLVAVNEQTPNISITGYVGTPASSKKKRGLQYFFVNNRFIKSGYLDHAVKSAYFQLIPEGEYPAYFLFITVPPNVIDVNIHPTKTEIKFEDEKTVYAILKTSVKRALGKNNLAPSIDFDQEQIVEFNYSKNQGVPQAPKIQYNPSYNPFTDKGENKSSVNTDWKSLYEDYVKPENQHSYSPQQTEENLFHEQKTEVSFDKVFQLQNKYIVAVTGDGLLLIDQQRAHERIMYEHYKKSAQHPIHSQQELFPQTVELSGADMLLLKELNDDLKNLGFDIVPFGKDTIVVQGVPADLSSLNSVEVLNGLLENYKLNNLDIKLDKGENICRALAQNTCIKYGKELQFEEMKLLVEHLFACDEHAHSPQGKIVYTQINQTDIDKLFKRN
ncbi:MAG TPA: DNA mismatch repair endonuclease MutL [Bacteroidia bacterium]|nr:DNA mismatch repair endonuclease MutL [Bacteroidia bacterium]